ncbi:MAG: hypothetical protein AAFN59_02030 [Pseudomonadota bacterium]
MANVKQMHDPLDPKGLIRESYRIDGITESECRSIFLDWAIGVPVGEDAKASIKRLVAQYGMVHPDHPMTRVLRDGLGTSQKPARRGGRKGRVEG